MCEERPKGSHISDDSLGWFYGVARTEVGYSHRFVGTNCFTLLGFMRLYSLLAIVFSLLLEDTMADRPKPIKPGRPLATIPKFTLPV
jgi:hypothetical protein